MEVEVYEALCCGASHSENLMKEVKEYFKNEIEIHLVNLLDNPNPVSGEVMAALLSYGEKALPLILIDGKVVFKRSFPPFPNFIKLINSHKIMAQMSRFSPEKLMKPVTQTEFLLSPTTLNYSMVTPQCCSTTYFCACSST